jgi:hypothetical protein
MPTLLAVDTSLSMGAPIDAESSTLTRKNVAVIGVTHFLKCIGETAANRHEQLALVGVSICVLG